MGAVYLAEHAALGRRAAVKVLLPALSAEAEPVARFFTEARAVAAVQHPSIVEIYDFGHLPDGSAYLVMELLTGESLAARRRRFGRLDARRALALTRQLAGALGAAHDAGIVHRDLKPDNVFIVPDPEVPGGERIKILDFGVAKLASPVGDVSQTQTGSVLGTPVYMSPEQCRNAAELDVRADLYSLGCVLYELVCGRPPFAVDSVGDLIAHHLYFEPPAPRSCVAEISEGLERLILWLLRKEPADRPQTARAVVDAIDQLVPDLGDAVPAAARSHAPSQPVPIAVASLSSRATSTTLTAASGAVPVRRTSRARGLRIAGVAAVTVVAGIVGFLAVDGGRRAPSARQVQAAAARPPEPQPAELAPVARPAVAPAPPSPPAAPPSVRLALDSRPRGATVVVAGQTVGTTPFVEQVPAGSPSRVYTLKKAGYEITTATLDTARDASQQIELRKQTAPPRPAAAPGLGDKGVNPFDN